MAKINEDSVWFVCFDMSGYNPEFDWDDLPHRARGWGYGIAYGDKLTDAVIARLPTSATQQDKKKVYDFGPMPQYNWCSQKFKDVVESVEPGVHRFFPVTLKAKDGTPHPGQFYIFNPGQAFPAILIQETNKLNHDMGLERDLVRMGRVQGTNEPYWGGIGILYSAGPRRRAVICGPMSCLAVRDMFFPAP